MSQSEYQPQVFQQAQTTIDDFSQKVFRSLQDLEMYTDQELESTLKIIKDQEQSYESEIAMLERHIIALTGSLPPENDKKKNIIISADGMTVSQQAPLVERLKIDQKLELASREVEDLKEQTKKIIQTIERDQDNYRAEIEECDLRVSEIKKASHEFRREIEQQSIHHRTGKVMAEKVSRNFDERIRFKDSLIEKTKLKNATLKAQLNKVTQQLRQKEESGEVLNGIDFDQLSIENSQYQAKIEEKNKELFKLKTIAGGVVSNLNNNKSELTDLLDNSGRIRNEIKQRTEFKKKLGTEVSQVQAEINRLLESNKHLRTQMQEFKVPSIMEYVEENIKNADIETALSSWGRKNTVKEAELKRLNNRIKQVTALLEQKKKTGKPPVMPLNTPGSRNSAAASRLTSRLHSAVSNSAGRQEVSTLDIQVGNNEK